MAWGQYLGLNGSWGSPVVSGGTVGTALQRIQLTGINTNDWTPSTPNPALYQPTAPTDGGVGDAGTADAGIGGVADAGAGTNAQPGPAPSGDGQVPLNTTGCSATATGSGGLPALGLLLAALGLMALRRRRAVDPVKGRR